MKLVVNALDATRGGRLMLYDLARPLRQPVHSVQSVPLHHVPVGRRVPDRAGCQLHSGPAGDPLAEVAAAQGQPIRSDGPERHLIEKKGTPTMGGVLILSRCDLHAAVGGSAQSLCLGGAVRHARLWRAGICRRLSQAVAQQPQGCVGAGKADRAGGDRADRRGLARAADARAAGDGARRAGVQGRADPARARLSRSSPCW